MATLAQYKTAKDAAKAARGLDDALNEKATVAWLNLSEADRAKYLAERQIKSVKKGA